MAIEKKTDELRVVRHMLWGKFPLWVTRLQRKYLVQNGDAYVPLNFGPPSNPEDEFIGMINDLPHFQPMKVEWRDLPAVSEKQARE